VRWFQFGAFCPLCRPHGDQTELREPWQFAAEVEAICLKYLRIRYRLLPYIYTALRQACAEGVPMMRALVLEFPQDPNVLNISDEYLFGSEILVSPVMDESATERRVYLPEGGWIDFWSEAVHQGPKWIEVSAPLDMLPLFVRQGAIIPVGPEVQYSSQAGPGSLMIDIYRGANRSFVLYEDDGETSSYENGDWAETAIEVEEGPGFFTCRIGETRGDFGDAKSERAVVLNIHLQPSVRAVECNGIVLDALPDADALEKATAGWWFDSGRLLTIKARRQAEALAIQVS
jgi:alpha-glucosidase (family GH31 glycosyl hydrolase)